jgi:hypothetical protein
MSTRTHTKSRNTTPEVSTWLDSPRELHHAEDNHEGCVSDCGPCDRFELAQYNGYIDGLSTWFEEVGQFLDAIHDTIGTMAVR